MLQNGHGRTLPVMQGTYEDAEGRIFRDSTQNPNRRFLSCHRTGQSTCALETGKPMLCSSYHLVRFQDTHMIFLEI